MPCLKSSEIMKIKDSRILITGAANGIGKALAGSLSLKGANVAALDLSEVGLNELTQGCEFIRPYCCDLTDSNAVSETIDLIIGELSGVDVLINSAGVMHSEPVVRFGNKGFVRHDPATWDQVIAINLTAVFVVTSRILEAMVSERTRGVVINFSSISAQGNAGQSAYSASKAGVEALTKTWAKEFGIFGIRAACISPGFIDTPATRAALDEETLKNWSRKTPLKRLGTVMETVAAVEMIIENDFFNGRVLNLDGGLVI
jgi:3-oxoacyl-[acyl-carrier protein] reductase